MFYFSIWVRARRINIELSSFQTHSLLKLNFISAPTESFSIPLFAFVKLVIEMCWTEISEFLIKIVCFNVLAFFCQHTNNDNDAGSREGWCSISSNWILISFCVNSRKSLEDMALCSSGRGSIRFEINLLSLFHRFPFERALLSDINHWDFF